MEGLSNKQIQRKRMMMYFVDATIELIDAEGIGALSIRKVAERAGYNSATLYHYFTNLRHITFFSCIRYLREYVEDLPNYLKEVSSPLDKYFKIWECFCTHAYNRPEIYELLFFEDLEDENFDTSFQSYYQVFPEELTEDIQDYYDMFLEHDIYTREFLALKKSCTKMDIDTTDQVLTQISEMNVLIFRGMLSNMKSRGGKLPIGDAVKRTLLYMNHTCISFELDKDHS